MTARITLPSPTQPSATRPPATQPSPDPATTGRPAPNRAARRARRKGADPAPATRVPVTPHGTVSTKPVRHRTDYAARRSG